jgi:hypothetical protein
MRRSTLRILTVALASIVLGACKNGPNNAYDTNGIGAGSAAGQVPPGGVTPGGTAGAATSDTSAAARSSGAATRDSADTSHRSGTPRPRRP